jgi:signal transduction histidine kinase
MHHASKKDSEQRLRRQERLATLGQVAGSIGHDLRSPLAVISSSNYLLRCRIGDDPSLVRHLDKIDVEVGACQKIISDLLEMTRLRPPRVSHHLAIDCIRGALERINLPANVTLTTHADPDLPLLGEIGLLQQALINMVGNSLKAVGSRGTIAISAEVRDGNFVALTVEDDGPGFDAEILPRAFEPLVSSRGGTGLGLALVVSVAQRHGGTAVAENTRNGARVTILLPKQPSD